MVILGLAAEGHQMRVEWSKMTIFASFARYILQTFTFKATIIILYDVASPLVALH